MTGCFLYQILWKTSTMNAIAVSVKAMIVMMLLI